MENSKFLRLGWKDLIKGIVMAVLGAIVIGVYQAIEAHTFELTWVFFKPILKVGVSSGLAYLIKNVFKNADGEYFKK